MRTLPKSIIITVCAAVISAISVSCQHEGEWSEGEEAIINSADDILRVLTVADGQDSTLLRQESNDLSSKMLRSPEYAVLAAKMIATVTSPEQDGVGIAGPQVGILRRVVAVQRFDKNGEPFEVYPNISIIAMRGEAEPGPEGCLSVPDCRGTVMRSRDIDIRYTSPVTLSDTVETVTGFTAVIFQHECDHLDGVLYTDRATKLCAEQ